MTVVEIGRGLAISVDVEALMKQEAVFGHVVYMGLRNILMDCHANIVREDCVDDADYRAKKLAVANKKLEAMMSGVLRAKTGSSPKTFVDPVEKEANKMARTFVYGKAKGWEKGEKGPIAYIAALAKALEMEGSAEKDILLAAIEKRAERKDVIEAARLVVESNSIEISADDLGI